MGKSYRMATGWARCSGWPNQSPSVAASELARRRLPDFFILYADDPVSRSAKKSEIRNSEIFTQDSGEPEFTG